MHAQHPRLNTYHSQKQRVLGHQAAQPAPAWRPRTASGSSSEIGSKILLSRLPADVVENEVEVLFSRTVGPVKEVLLVYNSQGKSRGMAVVSFSRPGDAAVARTKYNGKIVDGRRPIKIEIVVDEDDAHRPQTPTLPAVPSLLTRLGPSLQAAPAVAPVAVPAVNGQKSRLRDAIAAAPTKVSLRAKKGPRRLNKQRGQQQQAPRQQQQQQKQPGAKQKQKPKTVAELDAEMDDYRAQNHGDANMTAV
ncbi:hypothetical protein C8Q80DRAFT_1203825 [Daedaleopsis nitida]|nr:hypothetical protein C8Q80DRAFT_1203825 [Daedaleopsis nitida]